jgi:hypothetical protein
LKRKKKPKLNPKAFRPTRPSKPVGRPWLLSLTLAAPADLPCSAATTFLPFPFSLSRVSPTQPHLSPPLASLPPQPQGRSSRPPRRFIAPARSRATPPGTGVVQPLRDARSLPRAESRAPRAPASASPTPDAAATPSPCTRDPDVPADSTKPCTARRAERA